MRPQRDRRCSEINFLTSPSFNGSLRPLTFQQAKTIADKRKRQPVRVTLSSTSKRRNYSCFYSSWVTEHGPYCPKSQQLTNRPRGFRSGVGDRCLRKLEILKASTNQNRLFSRSYGIAARREGRERVLDCLKCFLLSVQFKISTTPSFKQTICAAYSCQYIPTTPPPLKGWKKKQK